VLYLSSMARRQVDIFLPMRLVISWGHCHVFLQTKWSMSIFLYGWVGFAVLYLVNTILFRSAVLIFVDLGGGGEWPDVCCSVLTSITINWSGDVL